MMDLSIGDLERVAEDALVREVVYWFDGVIVKVERQKQ